MKTEFSHPTPDTITGPRRPVIRVWHDCDSSDHAARPYIERFEATMTRVFVAAFRRTALTEDAGA